MKHLVEYISETAEDGLHGWWEKFTDEDTGEELSIWRVEDTPEITALISKYDDEEEKQYDAIRGRWKKWREDLLSLTQAELDAEDELAELNSKKKELYSEMEEEVSHAKEEDKDSVANRWGGELGNLEDEISNAIEKVAKARKSTQEHIIKQDDILDAEDRYWQMHSKHMDEIQKLRDKITW